MTASAGNLGRVQTPVYCSGGGPMALRFQEEHIQKLQREVGQLSKQRGDLRRAKQNLEHQLTEERRLRR